MSEIPTSSADASDTSAPAPVVTLLGDAEVTLLTGSAFSDSGATAADAENSPLTVSTVGFVDVSTPGVYRIFYSATDSFGQTATVTRTVTVVYRNSGEPLGNITLGAY